MKKLVLLLAIVLYSGSGFSQDFTNLKSISLNDSIECKKAESQVLECSNYLLTHPCDEDFNSLYAIQFLLRWMGQTPDYSFSFGDKLYKIIKSDLILTGRYLACQATIALNTKPKNINKRYQYNYIKMFLEYSEKPIYGVKISSKLKKLIEAKNEDKLMEVIEK
jgi:hypothetical protein